MSRSVVLYALVVSLFTSLCDACSFDAKDDRAHCSSFSSFQQAGNHPEWKKLNLVNNDNQPLSALRKGIFANSASVVDLQVKGLANEIERGAFNGLDNLYELHLDDNKINVIPGYAFANLPIEVMYIYFCDVHEMQPKSFDKLRNLKYVYIYGNHIARIEAGVFTSTNIGFLNMRKNGIKSVAPNAFSDMDNLFHLSLEENELTQFKPQLTIGHAPKLTHLYINRNQLTSVTRDMFSIMPNLRVLLLNINSVQRFGDHAFNDLRKLSLLDISNNQLEDIQPNVFNSNGMRDLRLLFLHDNQLTFLSTGLLVRLPMLTKMSVGGNPWQCPCWEQLDKYMMHNNVTRLCYEEYSQGNRPFCVFSESHAKDCIYDVENMRDIPQIYVDTLEEYPKLPRVCNVDGVAKPVLGA